MLFCDVVAEGVGEGVEIMLDAVLFAIGTVMLMAAVVAILAGCCGCRALPKMYMYIYVYIEISVKLRPNLNPSKME